MYNMNGVRHALYEQSKAGTNFNNLSKLVVSPENILLAYRNVKGNKGAKTPGTDGKTMADIDAMSVEEVIENVRRRFNWYNPKPVRRVEIPKPNVLELEQTEDTYVTYERVYRVKGIEVIVRDERIGEALQFVLPNQRAVLLLSFFRDYCDMEIARLLKISHKTVAYRKKIAMNRLRMLLEGMKDA